MANKSNRGPGRPAKFINLNKSDIFSLKEVFAQNPDVAKLTVRKRVNQLVESGVHESEWRWAAETFDYTLENNGTRDALRRAVGIVATTIS